MNKAHGMDDTNSREEQSRRSACDRCRGQKLRCERKTTSEHGGNACKRCIKARVRCITSPQRRLGRPRQQSLPRESRLATPTVLDFDSFLDSRKVDNVGDDFSDLCNPRAPRLSTTSATGHEPILNGAGNTTDPNAQQTDGHTISPFDAEYMFIDSPIFHDEPNNYTSSDIEAAQVPDSVKDDCLEKLSQLNSSLFRQLSNVASGKLADWLNFSPSSTVPPMQQTGELFSDQSTCGNQKSPIGCMLQSSQEFLNILRCFAPSPSPPSSYSPSHSSMGSSYSDFDPDDLFSSAIKPESYSSSDSSDHRPSIHESLLLSKAPSAARQPACSAGPLRSDISATLAILTCYVCLVRIYGSIFTQIHHLLLIRPSSLAELPAILPGLQLGGFELDGQQHLQIGVLLEISMHMLDQIEMVLGLPTDGEVGRSGCGLLEDSTSLTLLNIVINQEAAEGKEGDRAGVKSLRMTVKSIKGLLRG